MSLNFSKILLIQKFFRIQEDITINLQAEFMCSEKLSDKDKIYNHSGYTMVEVTSHQK